MHTKLKCYKILSYISECLYSVLQIMKSESYFIATLRADTVLSIVLIFRIYRCFNSQHQRGIAALIK